MKLFLLLIVGGGIIFPMDCVEGIRFGREAKAFKQMNSNNSLSYASYYPTASPSTIGVNDNDSLVQHGLEDNNSNGVDDEDFVESTSTTSTVDSTTTTFATTISTTQSTSISTTVPSVDLISEDASLTLSTTLSTLATQSTSLVDQANSDASSVSTEHDETNGSSCTFLVGDSEQDVVSIEIPFYYQLETKTFDDEILTNIEETLLSGVCSVSESIRRLSNNTDNQILEWNTNPKDTISENYDCTPSSDEAQLCNVVEAAMTVYYDGDDDEAAIETHAYQKIEDQFSSLSVDDSRVVSVKYIGNSPPIETDDESVDTVQEEEIVSLSYVPSPFVITASGILLFALMIGIYGVLMRGRRKGVSSSDNDTLPPPATHEEVESIYATKEDESQATTVLHANLDTSIPIVPRYFDNDDETMHTLKQIVLGEDEETRTEWERLGILPVVA